jgi:hypothetical protein
MDYEGVIFVSDKAADVLRFTLRMKTWMRRIGHQVEWISP